jgi:hypothetical protein
MTFTRLHIEDDRTGRSSSHQAPLRDASTAGWHAEGMKDIAEDRWIGPRLRAPANEVTAAPT